jgi:hypothetical protein
LSIPVPAAKSCTRSCPGAAVQPYPTVRHTAGQDRRRRCVRRAPRRGCTALAAAGAQQGDDGARRFRVLSGEVEGGVVADALFGLQRGSLLQDGALGHDRLPTGRSPFGHPPSEVDRSAACVPLCRIPRDLLPATGGVGVGWTDGRSARPGQQPAAGGRAGEPARGGAGDPASDTGMKLPRMVISSLLWTVNSRPRRAGRLAIRISRSSPPATAPPRHTLVRKPVRWPPQGRVRRRAPPRRPHAP